MSAENQEKTSTPKLYIFDGSAMIYRAHFATGRRMSNSRGLMTGALFGFLQTLRSILDQHDPQWVAMTFDAHDEEEAGQSMRHEIYAEYKANRDAMPDALREQLPYFAQLTRAMNIPTFVEPRVEADDVIATLTRLATDKGVDVCIISGDKDLMQLLTEHVTMYDPKKDAWFDPSSAVEKFGVEPALVPHVQALAGDASDNVPGVPGIGLKTGGQLIAEFGSLENLLANAHTIGAKKRRESLIEFADQARLSYDLVLLHDDLDLKCDLDDLRLSAPDHDAFFAVIDELEFNSLRRAYEDWFTARGWPRPERLAIKKTPAQVIASPQLSLLDALGGKPAQEVIPEEEITLEGMTPDGKTYEMITTPAQLDAVIAALEAASVYCIDLETTSVEALEAEIVGVALSWAPHQGVYIPVAHSYEGAPAQLDRDVVLARLKPLLEADDHKKIGQNVKYEWLVLGRYGITFNGIRADTMLMSYMLDPGKESHSLDALAMECLGYRTLTFTEVAGKGKKQVTFDQVDVEVATRYAAEDADLTLLIADVLGPKLQKRESLQKLHDELELPLAIILGRMERQGICMDPETLHAMSDQFEAELADLQAEINAFAIPDEDGNTSDLNPNSPKQLREVLFDHLELPVIKRTKSGPSTAQDVLEELAGKHPLPALILEYRKFAKLKSTYVDALPLLVRPETGRVHTSFNQAIAATGRLSSSGPNLQNIPIRTDRGRLIRAAFVAQPGWVLLGADYSQIELRILAHMSQDPLMLKAYQEDQDIHALTASNIFGVPIEEVTSDQRRTGKTINFGVIYGMGAHRLASSLGITYSQAQTYITEYFERYSGVATFFEGLVKHADDTGWAETLFGRRRAVEGLDAQGGQRAFAERVAQNTPIQGTAADIIKMAMVRLDAAIRQNDLPMHMLLQVHDELIFEVDPAFIDQARALVREHMEGVVSLDVPLKVDMGTGENWLDLK